MSGYAEKHEARKNKVLELLRQAQAFFAELDDEKRTAAVASLAESVEKNEFLITVVGEFSAGKSTFLNALMRERMLPSFSNETTATVNFLCGKNRAQSGEAGIVYFYDGHREILPDHSLKTIERYCTTSSNIPVVQNIAKVELFLDSKFLDQGVTLVDSPGLNGCAAGHREVTENQIRKSHAVIFLFNADRPGSKTDFEFLREVKNQVSTLFLVLNKIDVINPVERNTPESIIKQLKVSYKQQFPEETVLPEFWPIAAWPALVARNTEPLEYRGKKIHSEEEKTELEKSSRMVDFENRVWKFLTLGEKTRQLLLSPIENTLRMVAEQKQELEETQMLLSGEKGREELSARIAEQRELLAGLGAKMKQTADRIREDCHKAIVDTRAEIDVEMDHQKKRQLDELNDFNDIDDINQYLGEFQEDYVRALKKLANYATDALRDRFSDVIAVKYSEIGRELLASLESGQDMYHFPETVRVTQKEYKIGLEQFEAETSKVNKEVEQLEDQLDGVDLSKARAERLEAELREKKGILEARQTALRDYRLTFNPPSGIQSHQSATGLEDRGGVLGKIAEILVGKKRVAVNRLVVDDSQKKEYMDWFNTECGALKTEIQEANANLERQKTMPQTSDEYTVQRAAIQRQLTQLYKKRDKLYDEQKSRIQKVFQKQLRAIRRSLGNFCEETAAEYARAIRNVLRDQEEGFAKLLTDTVEANLRSEMEMQQKKLEVLGQEYSGAQKELEQKKAEIGKNIDVVLKLLQDCTSLQSELESLEINKIEQATI